MMRREGTWPRGTRTAKRAPDAVPDKRAKCAGACTRSCKKGQERRHSRRFFTTSPSTDSETHSLPASQEGCPRKADGVTWEQYGVSLEDNLRDLHARLHRGAYRAKPSRRVYIPKADGRQRPLGVCSLEDKLVQRAVAEVMGTIFEQDFLGFSYGFRPGRSQHQALDALYVGIARTKVNYLLDADIRGFFDAIDHGWLVKFVEHRIADARILRLIQKWLTAGVMEEGKWTETPQGTPQGATISPLLAKTSTCTTSSTSGSGSGGRGARGATSSSQVRYAGRLHRRIPVPRGRRAILKRSYASDCDASNWNCTPTRRASSPSGSLQPHGERNAA